jgi:hypothetical protein
MQKMIKIVNFIWEPIKEPIQLIAIVGLLVLCFVAASYFMFAGILLCIHLEWFDWKFSIGIIWAIISLWMVIKLIHEL